MIFRTDDHSVVFRMLKEGILKDEEQARTHARSNELTRAAPPTNKAEIRGAVTTI